MTATVSRVYFHFISRLFNYFNRFLDRFETKICRACDRPIDEREKLNSSSAVNNFKSMTHSAMHMDDGQGRKRVKLAAPQKRK